MADIQRVCLLLVVWAIYAYRDIWPLLTYALYPVDSAEGALLWIKLTLITLAAIFIPLAEPYPYIPVDPKVRLAAPPLWVHPLMALLAH